MEKKDLKAGYLLEFENGYLAVLMPIFYHEQETLAFVSNLKESCCQQILSVDPFEDGLIRVYGLPVYIGSVWTEIKKSDRPLLWEKPILKKKVTLELTDEQLKKIKEIINE